LYRIISQPLTSGATTLVPVNIRLAMTVGPVPRLRRETSAAVERIQVRSSVGRRVSEERRRGKGPNQRVAKRRREKTWRLDERREARTVEPDKAAVRDKVEGRGARRARCP
jgi:stalled ribosome alternative rescue factor ArfA